MKISKLKTSFLIIQNWDGFASQLAVKDEFLNCFTENEHFEILLLTNRKRPKENFEFAGRVHTISKSDFSLFGKLKSKNLLPSEHTHFDYILLLDDDFSALNKIVQQMKIKNIVGFQSQQNYVNINLNTSVTKPTEKIIFALQTLSKFVI